MTCGHVCSLALQPDADATITLVMKAGVAIVSLPMCNLYLQDRVAGRTPSELLARPQSDRLVIRDGKAVTIAPPDYAVLDVHWPERP